MACIDSFISSKENQEKIQLELSLAVILVRVSQTFLLAFGKKVQKQVISNRASLNMVLLASFCPEIMRCYRIEEC